MAKKSTAKKTVAKKKAATSRSTAKKKPKAKAIRKRGTLKATTNALEIIDRKFYKGKRKQQELLEQARADDEVGRKIFALRTKAGLSQREFAKLVGTTASVICRLEDADYDGHSLPMLRRIASALNKRVEIRFVAAQA